LASILGFTPTNHTEPKVLEAGGLHEADSRPDLLRGTYNMYIYSNICSNVLVGNSFVPLLRAIPLKETPYGQVQSFIFEKPIYVPVTRRSIDTIEVELRDDTGELMPLEEGKTLLLLQFRPQK
jgi:hypothetical protein